MKLSVIGTGYVGLVTGTCFAESGNTVICMDIDEGKISLLRAGSVPIYEPGLEELIKKNTAHGRLSFTTDMSDAVRSSDVIFIAVGTPPGEDGSADLKYVIAAATQIGKFMNGHKVIVNKSTVPVGTGERVRAAVAKKTKHSFDVVSNPEFLKEGSAIDDFMKPDRVVVGADSQKAAAVMQELYAPFVRTGKPVLVMDIRSSEMTKYVANAMLATKISFINEMANICASLGADIDNVRKGIGYDRRIGFEFLFPGVGYGGSCFPKDVQALMRTAAEKGIDAKLLKGVEAVNERQKAVIPAMVVNHFLKTGTGKGGSPKKALQGRKIALWGLSFKPRTDDMREAPSIVIVKKLLQQGASVMAHDPVAMEEAKKIFGRRISYAEDAYEALRGVDALAIVTEWNEFRMPDFQRMKKLMKHPVIFDGRNILNLDEVRKAGFTYYGIGKK
ncbi:MAG: UDP-glucose 6-dehydrogenase [Nitrospirae bacterium GWC2_57_13]|jgi:UDPglucose 6-dehydrogenase|nr:MAG: UDP-glucose 6-dehydrogenase [Nitrospirae bacterium GWC2_57_13]